MKRLLLILCMVAMVGVSGCAKPVQKDWVPTSGSRADATVRLSYEFDPRSEVPQTSEQQALEAAKKRCNSWGYSEVEAFGGTTDHCTQFVPVPFAGIQCARLIVTKVYQCIGRGDSELPGEVRK